MEMDIDNAASSNQKQTVIDIPTDVVETTASTDNTTILGDAEACGQEELGMPDDSEKEASMMVLGETDTEQFDPSSVVNSSQNQWKQILNLQQIANLAQANLVAATQERIAKEYGIDTDLQEITTVSTSNQENEKKKATEKKPVICAVAGCGREFSTPGNLKFHMQAMHKIQTQRLECKEDGCSRKFAWPAHLKYHQLTHKGERQHKCAVAGCNKRFYTAQQLNVHSRTHTGERPFVCEIVGCSKAFSTVGNLRNHMRTHTGERPFACEHDGCNRRFAEHSSLKKHMLVHSGNKPYRCSVCGKMFTQSSSRNVHMKRHLVEHEEAEQQASEQTTEIAVGKQNVLVLRSNQEEILTYRELQSADTLVFTQSVGDQVVTVSTHPVDSQQDQLDLHTTMLNAHNSLEEGTSISDSDIMNSATGANVVVLTQPPDMSAMPSNLHDNQITQEIIYTSDLLPVGLDHEEIASNTVHHDITGSNVIIGDVKGAQDEGIPIVIVPMLGDDIESPS